jgi:septum formation protein
MLVLASASPRRRELLHNAGFEFTVQPANVPELLLEGETAGEFVERLAREKALTVFQQRPHDLVLGADTIVVVEGAILGKPQDAEDALRMLQKLSGRTHQVTTGICLTGAGFSDTRSATTSVSMAPLSDHDIRCYIASGEAFDKAGAYAIQGMASRWISRIEGDYFNVVGLPVSLLYRMLRAHGAA